MASSNHNLADVATGAAFRAEYPFVRTTYTEFDADGCAEVKSWKPGVRMEERFIPPDDRDTDCVADGLGEILLTVISVHKPGRYPTRVFFTRRWRSPDGHEFGKQACRIATLEKFRRLARGYAHPYTVKDAAEKAA